MARKKNSEFNENESENATENQKVAGKSAPEEQRESESESQGNSEIPTIDISQLGEQLASEQSEVSEHTVAVEMQKQDNIKKQNADKVDSDGNPFDPSIHVTDSEGNPVLTSTGKLRKRPGRKGGAASGARSQVSAPSATTQFSGQDKTRASGVQTARMMTGVAVMLGGDEWRPMKSKEHGIDEQASLEEAFADYFEAKEMDDIPPGLALTMVMLSYAAPRFAMPKTKSRVSKVKDWFAAKYFNWKTRKSGGKVRRLEKEEKDENEEK